MWSSSGSGDRRGKHHNFPPIGSIHSGHAFDIGIFKASFSIVGRKSSGGMRGWEAVREEQRRVVDGVQRRRGRRCLVSAQPAACTRSLGKGLQGCSYGAEAEGREDGAARQAHPGQRRHCCAPQVHKTPQTRPLEREIGLAPLEKGDVERKTDICKVERANDQG